MIVRCGSCRTQFEVPGPGRYTCPVCGSVNAVRAAGSTPPPPQQPPMPGGPQPPMPPQEPQRPAPPPAPEPPSPKITCPECQFAFIVGEIAVATCPNCGSEVETGIAEGEEQE